MDFFPEIDVSATEAEAIARGLYAVALVDGLHERELALIADFFSATVEDDGGTVQAARASLARLGPLEPAALAALLPAVAHRELFLKTAYLLGWADGKVSPGERAAIDAFAAALGLGAEVRSRLEAEVKDYLMRPLAGLANVEGAAAVAKKLGL
jgi:tellurite resistance protein